MEHITINNHLKKDITFFCEDIIEEQLIYPILEKFKKNDYKTKISKDLTKNSEIGFYCCPANHIKKVNSKLSIISLGGMDQGKLFWPNFWLKEPWINFDVGILPGKHWAQMWKDSSWFEGSRPKFCMSVTGWPKSQTISNLKLYPKDKTRFNILYAPGFEGDEKGQNLINATKDLNINLHVKHLPWKEKNEKIKYKDIRDNIFKMIKFARKNTKNLKVYNSKENIIKIFNSVDLLVTDESSLIYESLLFNIPTLSCYDWKMRSSNSNKARFVKQNKDICIYTNQLNLRKKILEIIENYEDYTFDIKNKKNKYFSHIDNSVDKIFDLINQIVVEKKITNYEKSPHKINYFKSFITKNVNKFKIFINF